MAKRVTEKQTRPLARDLSVEVAAAIERQGRVHVARRDSKRRLDDLERELAAARSATVPLDLEAVIADATADLADPPDIVGDLERQRTQRERATAKLTAAVPKAKNAVERERRLAAVKMREALQSECDASCAMIADGLRLVRRGLRNQRELHAHAKREVLDGRPYIAGGGDQMRRQLAFLGDMLASRFGVTDPWKDEAAS